MNVSNVRNPEKEQQNEAFRCYDIFNMENGLADKKYIGCIFLNDPDDTEWRLNDPENKQFGNFVQCVAELKIQAELES